MEINTIDLPKIRLKLMKCKMITLNEMGLNVLTNAKNLKPKDKQDLLTKTRELFDTIKDEELDEQFNRIINANLFDNDNNDIGKYPIYCDSRFPEQQQKLDDEETKFKQLQEDITTNKLMDIAGNIIN